MSSVAKRSPITPSPTTPSKRLPTMYDLPSEHPDEAVPDQFHLWQAELCHETFVPPGYSPNQVFSASDLYLYYDAEHPLWYKRPDWFAAIGVSRFYAGSELRSSYVMWQEKVAPVVVLELLSPGTRDEDLGFTEEPVAGPPTKWKVYEQILAVTYYVTFDRLTNEWQVFELVEGRYQTRAIASNRFWMPRLQLGLGLWRGSYRGLERQWLRWYDAAGNWITTEGELIQQERELTQQERQRADRAQLQAEQQQQLAQQERQRAEQQQQLAQQERQRAEQQQQLAQQERQRADRLAEMLRQAGIDPDTE